MLRCFQCCFFWCDKSYLFVVKSLCCGGKLLLLTFKVKSSTFMESEISFPVLLNVVCYITKFTRPANLFLRLFPRKISQFTERMFWIWMNEQTNKTKTIFSFALNKDKEHYYLLMQSYLIIATLICEHRTFFYWIQNRLNWFETWCYLIIIRWEMYLK